MCIDKRLNDLVEEGKLKNGHVLKEKRRHDNRIASMGGFFSKGSTDSSIQ